MTRYDPAMREKIAVDMKGKMISSMEYVPEDDYFVIYTIDSDGNHAEFSFRFMADLV